MALSLIKYVLILVLLTTPATAVTIDNPYHVYQITKANVSFPTSQTYDSIELGTNNIKLNGDLFQITPSSAWVNVSMLLFGAASKSYTEDAPASYVVGGFAPNHKIYTTVDGSTTGSTDSDASGQITYAYAGTGTHTLRFDAASAPPSIVVTMTGQDLQWWVLLMIFFAVIGVVLHLDTSNKNRLGIIIAITIMVLAIGIAVGMI